MLIRQGSLRAKPGAPDCHAISSRWWAADITPDHCSMRVAAVVMFGRPNIAV